MLITRIYNNKYVDTNSVCKNVQVISSCSEYHALIVLHNDMDISLINSVLISVCVVPFTVFFPLLDTHLPLFLRSNLYSDVSMNNSWHFCIVTKHTVMSTHTLRSYVACYRSCHNRQVCNGFLKCGRFLTEFGRLCVESAALCSGKMPALLLLAWETETALETSRFKYVVNSQLKIQQRPVWYLNQSILKISQYFVLQSIMPILICSIKLK